MKYCTNCGKKLNENSNFCLGCGIKVKDFKNNKNIPSWAVVIIILLLALFIAAVLNIAENSDSLSNNSSSIDSTINIDNTKEEVIEYIIVNKDELDDELENNAAAAKEKYNNKYIEVTGKLGIIDSDLKYISISSQTKEWDFVGIHCTLKSKEQREIVKTLTKDQEVTIRGKVTDVGEVLGYYVDITEIVQ